MKRTNLVFGIGVNDANYIVKKMINGKEVSCPYYARWKNMLMRCFSANFQRRNKSYIGCSVSNDWLSFMSFKLWMENQDWKGKALDKDIIKPRNKIYSEENCCFVDESINNLLCDSLAIRGKYTVGVKLHKATGRLTARVKIYGKQVSLGYYDKVKDAARAYIKAKCDHIITIANSHHDERVKEGLILHAEILKEGY